MLLFVLFCFVGATPGHEALCASVPVAESLRAEVRADWEREARQSQVKINPSGEVMGAETWEDAAGAVDGEKTGSFGFHTIYSLNPWWQVDLGESHKLDRIVVYNRDDGPVRDRASGMKVLVSLDGKAWTEVFQHSGPIFGGAKTGSPLLVDLRDRKVTARYVRCQMDKQVSFHLDEVEVYGVADPSANLAFRRPADQSSAGRNSKPHPQGMPVRPTLLSGEDPDAYPVARTQEVLARGRRLLQALRDLDDDGRSTLAQRLGELEAQAAAKGLDAQERHRLYLKACEAVRELSLTNPLLDFQDILFVQRLPGTLAHMCDQYLGSLARMGGGLYVLEGFRDASEVRLRDVIGGQLPEGSYLSPDLSWDGRQILFSYAQSGKRGGGWNGAAELAYHVYTVSIDGSNLRKLTEGPFDDIHARWLPDGDILFLSTRRGGQTRCSGRWLPSYVLHRMKPDGSGITPLSRHETHEWHPAISNDGGVLYTRWDYVDRHTNIAHSLWSCRPDGSGAMAVFGNYNHDRKPWGLWYAAPVPGSGKVMAVAGAHHGYAEGSLVMVDPLRAFDGAEALERLTPEVVFPEAEGYPNQAYGSPYPLSEDFWLVAYSPAWSTRDATFTVPLGLYLMDRFGNRTLLYRDAKLPSLCPIPVRARTLPPRYPVRDGEGGQGTFVVQDVRASATPFAEEAIAALRIVQVLPKTTPYADDPRISVARQISARQVVGTVPVEADGSAHFRAPAGVPLLFQALDGNGMAVQTMRSVAYLQPGETRSCVGCHEPRQSAPATRRLLAAAREASVPTPGPDGSRPFSYVRLVQPVLDRNCVECHNPEGEGKKLDLRGDFASDRESFTRSYKALARKELVPWFDSINGGEWIPESTPGKLGARASKLIAMLRAGHHDVKLTPEDLERLVVWIDLNVPFYGAYEPQHIALQRKGEVVAEGELLQ